MTKLGFSESSGNPEKLLEDEQCHAELVEQDGTGKKLDFILSWISPYPIYGLFILLIIYDKCILDFFPVSLVFMLGAIFSFEMLHLILFCPPRNYKGGDLDVMDFQKYLSEGKMTMLKEVHFFCTLITLWIVCYVVREYASKFLPYSFTIQIIDFISAIIGTWRIFHFYRQGDWMKGSENLSILLSIFTQIIGILLLCGNRLFNIPQSDFVAFLCLMSVVFHLRFSYFFENPPTIECLLTIARTRAFVKQWYPWMVVFNGVLWSGLSLLILLPPNSPYTVPRPPCLVHNFIGPLVGFCILAPIIFFGTILKMYCNLGPINYDYLFLVKLF